MLKVEEYGIPYPFKRSKDNQITDIDINIPIRIRCVYVRISALTVGEDLQQLYKPTFYNANQTIGVK